VTAERLADRPSRQQANRIQRCVSIPRSTCATARVSSSTSLSRGRRPRPRRAGQPAHGTGRAAAVVPAELHRRPAGPAVTTAHAPRISQLRRRPRLGPGGTPAAGRTAQVAQGGHRRAQRRRHGVTVARLPCARPCEEIRGQEAALPSAAPGRSPPWLLLQWSCPISGEDSTLAYAPALTARVHSGVIVDQWDALVAELATTPDVVDRLLAEHVPDDSRRCRACTRPGLGTPMKPWPCGLYKLAMAAKRRGPLYPNR
jgi:hypothetical protein